MGNVKSIRKNSPVHLPEKQTISQKNLKNAICQIHQILETVHDFKNNKEFVPNHEELKLFEHLTWALLVSYDKTQHLNKCMVQRHNGEPEDLYMPDKTHDFARQYDISARLNS